MVLRNIRLGAFVGVKNIFKNKGTFIFVILIVALGFLNVVFMTAFLNGFSNTLNTQIIDKQFGNVVIEPSGSNRYIDNAGSVLNKIRAVPGVIGASKRYLLGATIETEKRDRRVSPWYFQGVDPSEEKRVTDIYRLIGRGSYLSDNDKGEIVLGAQLAGIGGGLLLPKEDTLEVDAGDYVYVSYANGIEKRYKVKGIAETKDLYATISAFISMKEAESILGLKDKASLIVVNLPYGREKEYIQKFKTLGIKDTMRTWEDKASTTKIITQSFDLINRIFEISGIFIIFVTIIIIIYINVLNNVKQIGILKAIGISEKSIIFSYLTISSLYGVFGVLLGGVFIIGMNNYLSVYPVSSTIGDVSLSIKSGTLVVSIVIILLSSLLGGLLPSLKYVRENIIKLIWG